MRDDFAALIVSHGRPDRVDTLGSMLRSGYTGRWYLVLDDEDETADEYRDRYGDERVVVFSKEQVEPFDVYDNFPDRRGVVYARNACWRIARDLGLRYFVLLDDDYRSFLYRRPGRKDGETLGYHGWVIRDLDRVLEAMVAFIADTPALTICMSQGGDHMGGDAKEEHRGARLRRKAMNSFVCDVERPYEYVGRINEDVNTYVTLAAVGRLLFTYSTLQLNQLATQTNEGGLTDQYLDIGTYVKSFYTVIAAPSCTTIRTMGRESRRLHHHVAWRYAAPKILRENAAA